MKKIKATFIGQDGNLGYEHGKEYELHIEALRWHPGSSMRIYCLANREGTCPYRNIETFLENWTHIEVTG